MSHNYRSAIGNAMQNMALTSNQCIDIIRYNVEKLIKENDDLKHEIAELKNAGNKKGGEGAKKD
jgi:cell division protein FtsL